MKSELALHICTQTNLFNGKNRNTANNQQHPFRNCEFDVFSDRLFFERPAQRF